MDMISTGRTTLTPLIQQSGIRVTIPPLTTTARPSAHHKPLYTLETLCSKWSQMINTMKAPTVTVEMSTGLQKRVSQFTIRTTPTTVMDLGDMAPGVKIIMNMDMITNSDHTRDQSGATIAA